MTLLAVAAIVGLLQAPVATSEQVPVFLGPIPSAEGFIAGTNKFKDSYEDLREELRKNREFQKVLKGRLGSLRCHVDC